MMQVDILIIARRSNEQGRHRGNRRRDRAYDGHTGKPGRKRLRDGLRDDIVDAAAIAGEIAREHARGQHAREVTPIIIRPMMTVPMIIARGALWCS